MSEQEQEDFWRQHGLEPLPDDFFDAMPTEIMIDSLDEMFDDGASEATVSDCEGKPVG